MRQYAHQYGSSTWFTVSDAASPITSPAITGASASARISRWILFGAAPAIRTPISFVRRSTDRATTAYSPIAASNSASTA
jgi:hypothetical protein